MEIIEVKTRDRVLYIEKEKTETLFMNPKIWKIPGAAEEILGVSVYKGRLAVYYRLGRERDAKCGVLMKTQSDMAGGVRKNVMGSVVMEAEKPLRIYTGKN